MDAVTFGRHQPRLDVPEAELSGGDRHLRLFEHDACRLDQQLGLLLGGHVEGVFLDLGAERVHSSLDIGEDQRWTRHERAGLRDRGGASTGPPGFGHAQAIGGVKPPRGADEGSDSDSDRLVERDRPHVAVLHRDVANPATHDAGVRVRGAGSERTLHSGSRDVEHGGILWAARVSDCSAQNPQSQPLALKRR